LNKYWKDNDITIVGYEDVAKLTNLPSNVKAISLGKQENFDTIWSDGLIPFFTKIPDKYFTLILDDHILLNEVDKKKMSMIEDEFINERVDKAMIGGGIPLSAATPLGSNLLLFNQDIDYRTSLHPAIWTKKYFLKYLKPNMTSWDFELKNNSLAKNDGARIINFAYDYPREPHLYSYLELYTKGTITINSYGNVITNQPSRNFFKKEDIKYIWDNIYQHGLTKKKDIV